MLEGGGGSLSLEFSLSLLLKRAAVYSSLCLFSNPDLSRPLKNHPKQFPKCTVLFADIVGFTAWSSVRDPTQVFTLLETLYNSFDQIAKKRKVFKVETIGDCYGTRKRWDMIWRNASRGHPNENIVLSLPVHSFLSSRRNWSPESATISRRHHGQVRSRLHVQDGRPGPQIRGNSGVSSILSLITIAHCRVLAFVFLWLISFPSTGKS
jgi:hypothetical protein